SLDAQWPAGTSTLIISGGTATLNWSGGSGKVSAPVGTLPEYLLNAAVAALPESLPSSAYVWVARIKADQNGEVVDVLPVRVDFGPQRVVRIAFANSGVSCGKDVRTTEQSVLV